MYTNYATNPRFMTPITQGAVPTGVAAESRTRRGVTDSATKATFTLSSQQLSDRRAARITFASTMVGTSVMDNGDVDYVTVGLPDFTGNSDGDVYTILFSARGGNGDEGAPSVRIIPSITGCHMGVTQEVTREWKTYRLTIGAYTATKYNTGFMACQAKTGDWVEVKDLLIVPGQYDGVYFDGDSPGSVWNGASHASTSTQVTGNPALVRNVLDYGANGDNDTDDTAAIQAALDDKSADTRNQPSTVYFPSGTYRVTKQLRWDPYYAQLLGDNATILCDMTPTISNPNSGLNPIDPATYAVRVLSNAPFASENSTVEARTAVSSGIKFVTHDNALGAEKPCNGLYIEGAVGDNGWAGPGTFDSGRRKMAHLTFSNMLFRGFGTAVLCGSFTYMMGFRDCAFSYNSRAVYLPKNRWEETHSVAQQYELATKRFDDRGERIYFDGCDFTASTYGKYTIDMEDNQTFKFFNCSFDWINTLLNVGQGGFVDFLGCHFETPADEFARGTTYEYPMFSEEQVTNPYIKLADRSQVTVSESLFWMNYGGDASTNTKPFLIHGGPWANVSITDSFFWMPNVVALTGGGVRASVVNPRFNADDPNMSIQLLSTDSRNNRLHDGVKNDSAIEFTCLVGADAASGNAPFSMSTRPGPDNTNIPVRSVYFPWGGDGTMTITVPATPGMSVAGIYAEMTAGDNTLTVTGLTAEYLDGSDTVLGLYSNAFDPTKPDSQHFTPVTLSSTVRKRVGLVHNLDATGWNGWVSEQVWDTRLIDKVRYTFTFKNAQAKVELQLSNVVINTYG